MGLIMRGNSNEMDEDEDAVPDLVPIRSTVYELECTSSSHAVAKGPTIAAKPRLENSVPVTLITGFLGAGKSTLVSHILSEHHGYRIAVILNEIGDQPGIESALMQDASGAASRVDGWVELNNGCLCCSVKDDFVNALESLMLQQTPFDYILIETTGLADPGPVAAALWTDEQLEAGVVLDCIVTVVDARNIRRQLAGNPVEPLDPPPSKAPAQQPAAPHAASRGAPAASLSGQQDVVEPSADVAVAPHPPAQGTSEAQRQVAYADVILLNKTDLVSASDLREISAAVRSHNAVAEVLPCRNSRVDLSAILDRGGYRNVAAGVQHGAVDVCHEHAEGGECGHAECGRGHGDAAGTCSDEHACSHTFEPPAGAHDPNVSTVSLEVAEPVSLQGFRYWMDTLLWQSAATIDIFRVKGLLNVAGSERKHGVQAVHELYEVAEGAEWSAGEDRRTRIVLIGRRLSHPQLLGSLRAACLPAD